MTKIKQGDRVQVTLTGTVVGRGHRFLTVRIDGNEVPDVGMFGQERCVYLWHGNEYAKVEAIRPLTSKTNPILEVFRLAREEEWLFTSTAGWARNLANPPFPDSWHYATTEQIEHARKVLERLARLEGGKR